MDDAARGLVGFSASSCSRHYGLSGTGPTSRAQAGDRVANGRVLDDRIHHERVDLSDVLAAAREHHGLERLEQIKYAVPRAKWRHLDCAKGVTRLYTLASAACEAACVVRARVAVSRNNDALHIHPAGRWCAAWRR